ncbi:MAG TPA: hydroxymethylbilane synthase [Polyangiales bacterium]|jgi:hydroxymethylbilane synthase
MKLRIATRRSALALAQSNWVANQLKVHRPDLEVEFIEVVTTGDRIQDVSLAAIGGKGLFVSEVEQVLLRGEAELAIHSLKDVPAELAPGLVLGAVPEREDARDVLVTAEGLALDDLTAGAKVGTNSPRRSLQLRRQRDDLQYSMLRGNVDTRLRKLDSGAYDAIVLAAAGLRRLSLFDRPLWPIPVEISVPAVGQGALALEHRRDDERTRTLLAHIDHAPSRAFALAERAFLAALGGDCHTPVAGHAQLLEEGRRVRFDGWVASHDGSDHIRASQDAWLETQPLAELAEQTAQEVASTLLSRGAREMLAEAKLHAAQLDPRSRA